MRSKVEAVYDLAGLGLFIFETSAQAGSIPSF